MRPDGRSNSFMLRPLSAELSFLHRADGSARFSSGQTSVLAAVYGPASSTRELSNSYALISVVVKQGAKGSNTGGLICDAKELEYIIQRSLSACVLMSDYPRSVIEVVVQVLKEDGSIVSTAFNAAVLALMDAGIAFRNVPIATTCVVSNGETITLDPCAEEETLSTNNNDNTAVVILVTTTTNSKDGKKDELVTSLTLPILPVSRASAAGEDSNSQIDRSFMTQMSFVASIEASFRASRAVIEFMRMAVGIKVSNEAQTVFLPINASGTQ